MPFEVFISYSHRDKALRDAKNGQLCYTLCYALALSGTLVQGFPSRNMLMK